MPTEEELNNMSPEEIVELQKQNCIFCNIIKDEIPGKKVYEDDDFKAVLDKNPGNKGHVLLLPKEHYQVMPLMPPELGGKVGVACKKVSNLVLKATGAKATSLYVSNGGAAGQNAPHSMIHIIPRFENDSIKLNPVWKEDVKHKEYKDKIKKALSQ